MASVPNRAEPRRAVRRVYSLALLLAIGLFYFHVVVIFDVAGKIIQYQTWLIDHLGPHTAGKAIILGCFLLLFAAHLSEVVAWGLFLRWTRLAASVTEGFYFTAASITTLGYGDVVLPSPWRHLGPLAAISGVLMFGCSGAFLFVVMQSAWERHL
jgi:hypothetical protein